LRREINQRLVKALVEDLWGWITHNVAGHGGIYRVLGKLGFRLLIL
jgi:hypothetical protein